MSFGISNTCFQVRVYTDDTFTTELCGCDECGGCGEQAVLTCTLDAGEYRMVIGGSGDMAEGDFKVGIACPGATGNILFASFYYLCFYRVCNYLIIWFIALDCSSSHPFW